jgi:hypothetical protein
VRRLPRLTHNRRLDEVMPHIAARLCVCEREPPAHFACLVPERIALRAASLLYAERAARAAGESVQRELQVFSLPRLLRSRQRAGK